MATVIVTDYCNGKEIHHLLFEERYIDEEEKDDKTLLTETEIQMIFKKICLGLKKL